MKIEATDVGYRMRGNGERSEFSMASTEIRNTRETCLVRKRSLV